MFNLPLFKHCAQNFWSCFALDSSQDDSSSHVANTVYMTVLWVFQSCVDSSCLASLIVYIVYNVKRMVCEKGVAIGKAIFVWFLQTYSPFWGELTKSGVYLAPHFKLQHHKKKIKHSHNLTNSMSNYNFRRKHIFLAIKRYDIQESDWGCHGRFSVHRSCLRSTWLFFFFNNKSDPLHCRPPSDGDQLSLTHSHCSWARWSMCF